MNNKGPRTEPCGTPDETDVRLDIQPRKTTAWFHRTFTFINLHIITIVTTADKIHGM